MTGSSTAGIGQAEVEAARLLLAKMGISPHDLLQTARERPAAPTFAEYIPVESGAGQQAGRRAGPPRRPAPLQLLEQRGVTVHITETTEAVGVYNALAADGATVAGLFHSTYAPTPPARPHGG